MSRSPDRLYDLLPQIYRLRDAEQGEPLRALLRVIAEQVDVVEDDIAQLYANWFIETCQEWVVPYIGELIGFRPVHEAGDPGAAATPGDRRRNAILTPRREVADTIRYRRRKGTLALLEQLAADVAGWPVRAVEFYRLLGLAQHPKHPRPAQGRTADLRRGDLLDLLGGPFDQIAHAVDVRRMSAHHRQGRFNIPSVGLFVWRLKSYAVPQTPAYCLEEVGPHCYTFSMLGNEMQLYIRPAPETDPTHIAEELNAPAPIRRRAFEERLPDGSTRPAEAYYGLDKSVAIWAQDWPRKGAQQPIPREAIIPADLTDWKYRPKRGFIAVDPVLGRIVFNPNQLPRQGVSVAYQYAFSADIGGGPYERPLAQPLGSALYRVGPNEGDYRSIKEALDKWAEDKQARAQDPQQPLSAVIEIVESGVYTEQLNISLQARESLQIRAANNTRPVIRLLDYMAALPDAFSIVGAAGSRFVLDGLLVAGRGLRVYRAENGAESPGGDICDVTIRHCTLVPGWTLEHNCEPKRPNEASIELAGTGATLIVEHSIVGTIIVGADQVQSDPNRILISDSIVDATSQERVAIGAFNLPVAFAALTIARTTVIGQTLTHAIDLAENSIFYGLVRVARRQRGCMRFCSVTPDSRTPRRYSCQPDLAEQAAEAQMRATAAPDRPPPDEILAARQRERDRVRPQFNSLRYSRPSYCQLAEACAVEITRGADDEAELGAFHDLYQPQRAANLRARLDEYTPAGMDAGIIYAS